MRAAAILGLGCSPKDLIALQTDQAIEWRTGMPSSCADADVVLLFGGDGTVHRHLGQLVKLGLPVLVVPAGSGNDFASSLGLRRVRDSMAAWRMFTSGSENVRRIDLGMISPVSEAGESSIDRSKKPTSRRSGEQWGTPGLGVRYFCCVAGVGLDGEVARRANELPRWLRGHGGYVLSLLPTIFRFAPVRMKIQTVPENPPADDQGWTTRSDQPSLLAAFANTPFYGGGMKIAPRARMDDGLLDVCIVGGVYPFKLFCMFPTVYAGRHLKIKKVEYCQTSRVRIETEHPLDVYADGEYVCRTPVEVTLQPAALRVIVPPA